MSIFRIVLLLLAIGVAIWVSISVSSAFQTTADQIKLVPYDEYSAKMFDFARSDVDRFFQIGVLIFAGLWVLAVLDNDNGLSLHTRDVPELIMFGIAMA